MSALTIAERIAAEFDVGPRVEVAICCGDEVVEHSVHSDASVRRSNVGQGSLFSGVCLTKPIVIGALCSAILDSEASIDSPMRQVLPSLGGTETGELTLRMVVNHEAGQVAPALDDLMTMRRERLMDLAYDLGAGLVPLSNERRSYSQVSAVGLLAHAAEVCTGVSASEVIQTRIAASGLDELLVFSISDSSAEGMIDRMGLHYVEAFAGPWVPMIHELVPAHIAWLDSPIVGGAASVEGMARWYSHVLLALSGEAQPDVLPPGVLDEVLKEPRSGDRPADPTLGRPAMFRAGFMVELADHGYGSAPSDAAVGHSGWCGRSFAWCDPTAGYSACCWISGVRFDGPAFSPIRARIVDLISASVAA